MGSGISRTDSGSVHSRRTDTRRTISSFLACGTASFSREMEDYPNEMSPNSAEHDTQKMLISPRKKSNLSLGNGKELISINAECVVSSGGHLTANEHQTPNIGACDDGNENKGKCLSENRQSVSSHQSIGDFRGNDAASTSYLNHSCPYSVSTNEMSDMDSMNGLNKSNTSCSPCHREPLLNEVSVENNVSDEVDFSSSDLSSPSFVSGSPSDYPFLREDSLQEAMPSGLGFVVSEMEQNRLDGNLVQVDVVSLSSNVLPIDTTEVSTQEARRNSRRLFWDAFSRHNSRNHMESRVSTLSPGDSDPLISHDGIGGNSRSHGTGNPGSIEESMGSRPENSERPHGTLDITHHRIAACPRGIHSDASCSCSSSLAEESGTRAGISRIVMLAEALFEVLDQIHQHSTPISLSVVSLPAPQLVVDSFPLKTHSMAERLESAEGVSQCYICLAEYEEGDKIRVLPCHHEFHMACVDKWLKEVHGVCPLCRRDVSKGPT